MALIKCPECGKKVSDKASTCPECGNPVPKKKGIGCIGGLLLLIIGLMVVVGISESIEENRKKSAAVKRAAQLQAAKIKSQQLRAKLFKEKRYTILAEIRTLIDKGEHQQAFSKAATYIQFGDPELKKLHSQANEQILLAKVKKIWSGDSKRNMEIYAQLKAINPKNEKYKKKYEHYAAKLKAKQIAASAKKAKAEKKRRARVTKFGEPPVQSGWDGSYRAVSRYLEAVANDPDSIKIDNCTKVYHIAEGWLVGCDYRGKNAFGGMVRNSNWFIIIRNTVVKMKPSDAYNP